MVPGSPFVGISDAEFVEVVGVHAAELDGGGGGGGGGGGVMEPEEEGLSVCL